MDESEIRALREENTALHAEVAEQHRRIAELERAFDNLNRERGGSEVVPAGRTVDKQGANKAAETGKPGGRGVDTPPSPSPVDAPDFAALSDTAYQEIKRRLIVEAPAILKVLVARPELEVEIERVVIHVRGDTLRGRIARLIADDFFAIAHTSAQILDELLRRGANRPSNIELGNELKALSELGFFTRENKWYNLVPDMKVNVVAA